MIIYGKVMMLALFVVSVVLLQVFLSKKKNKWLGLILPLIFFLFSLLVVLSVPSYQTGDLTLQQMTSDGTIIEETVVRQEIVPISSGNSIMFIQFAIFILYNIPTIVLCAIYLACEKNRTKT